MSSQDTKPRGFKPGTVARWKPNRKVAAGAAVVLAASLLGTVGVDLAAEETFAVQALVMYFLPNRDPHEP